MSVVEEVQVIALEMISVSTDKTLASTGGRIEINIWLTISQWLTSKNELTGLGEPFLNGFFQCLHLVVAITKFGLALLHGNEYFTKIV